MFASCGLPLPLLGCLIPPVCDPSLATAPEQDNDEAEIKKPGQSRLPEPKGFGEWVGNMPFMIVYWELGGCRGGL